MEDLEETKEEGRPSNDDNLDGLHDDKLNLEA